MTSDGCLPCRMPSAKAEMALFVPLLSSDPLTCALVHGGTNLKAIGGVHVVALMVAALFAGCSSAPPVASSTIVEAAKATVATGSAHIEFRVEFRGSSSISDSRSIKAAGDTEFGVERRFAFTMDLSDAGAGLFEARVDGRDAYFRADILARLTGDATRWLHVDLEDSSPASRELVSAISGPNDASLLVYYLLGTGSEVKGLGTESIGGVEATGYGISISLDTALDAIDPALHDVLDRNIAEMRANGIGPELSGEAWLDDQQLIRRVRYTIKLGSASGGGSMIVTADFSALGEPVAIDIPDAADVTNAEDVLD